MQRFGKLLDLLLDLIKCLSKLTAVRQKISTTLYNSEKVTSAMLKELGYAGRGLQQSVEELLKELDALKIDPKKVLSVIIPEKDIDDLLGAAKKLARAKENDIVFVTNSISEKIASIRVHPNLDINYLLKEIIKILPKPPKGIVKTNTPKPK
jgi:nitrogen regulatory protein PII